MRRLHCTIFHAGGLISSVCVSVFLFVCLCAVADSDCRLCVFCELLQARLACCERLQTVNLTDRQTDTHTHTHLLLLLQLRSFVRTDLVTTISLERPSNVDETCREHSVAPLLLTRLDFGGQRSRTQGHSRPSRWPRHPCRRCGVEVHF